jgi:hypothetical protein
MKRTAKRTALLTSALISLLNLHGTHAADTKPRQAYKKNSSQAEPKSEVSIRVAESGWGNVPAWQVELVLNAVAAELMTHFPGKTLDPVLVSPSQHGPVVLYQKGPRHEYQILLAAKDQRWAEYIYEFSHELFHVLAGYENHALPHSARHQWFEEMLCETVSLHMLKRFSLTWQDSPPLPEWRSYVPTMQAFTRRALSEPHRQLPANLTFEQWFRANGAVLASKPYLREKNELVATIFLPYLTSNPDWRAIAYLNVDQSGRASSFYDYLTNWYRATPAAHQRFVSGAIQLFRFKLPDKIEHTADAMSTPLPATSGAGISEGPAGPMRH